MAAPARHRSTHPMVAVLRAPALSRALGAFFVFNMAEWATYIAILVWAFESGGAAAAGLIAVVQLVPATIAAPFASVLGDRMRRDRALGVGYGAQSAALLLAAGALLLDAPEPVVYVAAARRSNNHRPHASRAQRHRSRDCRDPSAADGGQRGIEHRRGHRHLRGTAPHGSSPGLCRSGFGLLHLWRCRARLGAPHLVAPARRTFDREDDPEGT